jgi:hypothetical protein
MLSMILQQHHDATTVNLSPKSVCIWWNSLESYNPLAHSTIFSDRIQASTYIEQG